MGNHEIRIVFTIALSIVYFCSLFQDGESANILVYGAVGTHSTRISMFPLMEALANKAHKITFLSAFENFEDPDKKSKIEYYTPEKLKMNMGEWEDHISFYEVRKAGSNPEMWLNLQDEGISSCEVLYSDPEFVNWVKTSKYDLIIMESVLNECALGLVHTFNAKLIVYGTSTTFPWFPDAYGFPDETSSVPDAMFDFAPGDKMTFWQRIKNAVSPIVFSIKRDYTYFPVLEDITRKGLGLGKDELPSFREIEQNASLVLLTSHFTTDIPRSLPGHVLTIGGAAVGSKKLKPLSKEMEDFVNSAKSGFIFISFGTVAEFTNFDRDVQLEFIQALHAFPEMRFLWKSSYPINETLPKNVMVTKWAPQQTILAHPKIKAFVTHCGMGSITESVSAGVPLVLIPVLGEQDMNANAIEAKGAGIKLEITTLKQHELEHALREVLHTSKYRNAMKELSAAFRDRPVQPVENAVWWIEYILRHPNSNDYLVPLSVRQPWWKRRQIDVWLTLGAILLLGFSLFLILVLFSVKFLLKYFFSNNDNNKVRNESNNKLLTKKRL